MLCLIWKQSIVFMGGRKRKKRKMISITQFKYFYYVTLHNGLVFITTGFKQSPVRIISLLFWQQAELQMEMSQWGVLTQASLQGLGVPGEQCWCATPVGKHTQFHSLGFAQHSLTPGNCHWPISELVWHLLEFAGCMSLYWDGFIPLVLDQIQVLSCISVIWVHRLLRITLSKRVCSIAVMGISTKAKH